MTSNLLRATLIAVVALAPAQSLAQDPPVLLTDTKGAVVLASVLPREADAARQWVSLVPPPPRRPAILPALYVSYGALQVLDAYITVRVTQRGGIERNQVLAPIADHFGALLVVKAGFAASTIFLSEQLWKTHRKAAIVTMIAANGAILAISAHNTRQLHNARR